MQVVNCLLNPCDVTECPAHPEAVCNADYCGGCHARFYNADGEDVDCGAARGPNALDDDERSKYAYNTTVSTHMQYVLQIEPYPQILYQLRTKSNNDHKDI